MASSLWFWWTYDHHGRQYKIQRFKDSKWYEYGDAMYCTKHKLYHVFGHPMVWRAIEQQEIVEDNKEKAWAYEMWNGGIYHIDSPMGVYSFEKEDDMFEHCLQDPMTRFQK